MANNTTPYGRQQIEWPDLGSDPGVTLHGQVVAGITYLSNNITARWSGSLTLASSATVQITHHFGVALSALKIFVVESGAVLSESIQNASYTFTQVDTATVQVQNVSGVSKTFQVYIFPSKLNIRAADLDAAITVSTTGDVTAANIKATATLKTDDDNLELNSNAAGTGTDHKATIARGGSQSANATITLPSQTSTLATTSLSETLTNKTVTGVVVSDYEDLTHVATPATPGSGKLRFYAKSDNKLYVKDSTGTEAVVGSGSGSGQVNYLSKYFAGDVVVGTVSTVAVGGPITVSGSFPDVTSAWYANTGSGSAAIAVSTDNTLRGTKNFLTALTNQVTPLSGDTFVQTPAFNIDGEDLGKALTLQFDLSGVTTDDHWDVVIARYNSSGTFQELIPIAGNASSSTSTPSAKLPLGVTKFNGFFITSSTASDVYSVRFRRLAGSTQIRVDSVSVGPNQVLQGVIVTDWQTYTPALFNVTGGTLTTNTAKARRNGSNLEIYGKFNFSAAPSAVRIDFGLPDFFGTLTTTETNVTVGFWSDLQGAETPTYDYFQPCFITGGPSIAFKKLGVTNDDLRGDNVATGRVHSYYVTIPISQWQANTQMAARAVEEYAYNTDTSNADATATGFANGPDGALIPNRSVGTAVKKRVRFQTSVLPTDIITLEIYDPTTGAGKWFPYNQRLTSYISAAGGGHGPDIYPVANTATDVEVLFNKYGYDVSGGINANGGAWADLYTNGYKWRVRKVSGGAAVGYPVGARNVVGDTTGTAVPAGYLGEIITASNTSGVSTPNATDVQVCNTGALSPGNYMISGFITCTGSGLYGTGNNKLMLSLRTTSASRGSLGTDMIHTDIFKEASGSTSLSFSLPVTISATTTYYANAYAEVAAGSGASPLTYGKITAVRIA